MNSSEEDLNLRPGETEEFLYLYRDHGPKFIVDPGQRPNIPPHPEYILDALRQPGMLEKLSQNPPKADFKPVTPEEIEELEKMGFQVYKPISHEKLEQMRDEHIRRILDMGVSERISSQLRNIEILFRNKFSRSLNTKVFFDPLIRATNYKELEELGDKIIRKFMQRPTYEELRWFVDKLSNVKESIDHKSLSLIIGDSIRCCYVHPVTFKMVFEKLNIDIITWDSLAFNKEAVCLKIFSQKIGNKDNRGGGCGNKGIPVEEFKYTIENKNGITIRDLTEAVYRMKGSKYDYRYELYSEIRIIEETKDTVVVEAVFGYGS